jgi:hypothetical protein
MRGPNINTPPSTNRIDLAQSAHRVKSLQSYARRLLRCMSPELAQNGRFIVARRGPLLRVEPTSRSLRWTSEMTQTGNCQTWIEERGQTVVMRQSRIRRLVVFAAAFRFLRATRPTLLVRIAGMQVSHALGASRQRRLARLDGRWSSR